MTNEKIHCGWPVGNCQCTPLIEERDELLEEVKRLRAAPSVASGAPADELWHLIDAYADARQEYATSTARHLSKQQRENVADAKVALTAAIAASQQAAPVSAAHKDSVLLQELLARIHRDGGHHSAAVGTEQSAKDADGIIAAIYAATGPDAKLVEALQAIIAKYHSGQMVGGCVEIEIARAALAAAGEGEAELELLMKG